MPWGRIKGSIHQMLPELTWGQLKDIQEEALEELPELFGGG